MAVTNYEYLLPSEIVTYYDTRRVCGLISDTGTPIATGDLSDSTSDGFIAVQRLIRAISARIDTRVQQGKRYDRTDLEGIAFAARTTDPADPTYDANWKRFAVLNQLTADLFFGDLVARRGYSSEQFKTMAPRFTEAQEMLEALYNGVAIFDLDDPKDAGVVSVQTLDRRRLISTDFNRMFGLWPTGTNRFGDNPYLFPGSWRL